jgi:hypothetical protein
MSSRAGRARALIAVCGVATLMVATISAVSAGAAATPPSFGSVLSRCVRLMTGEPRTGARRIPGAAESQIAAQLSIFRATRTSADTLPAASNLGQALAGAQATTYDPSSSIRLNLGTTKSGPGVRGSGDACLSTPAGALRTGSSARGAAGTVRVEDAGDRVRPRDLPDHDPRRPG